MPGFVYFAQLLDEMLFDFTIDTHKPSAMNTSTLCLEARRIIDDIEGERIDKKNLTYVYDELISSFDKDEIAQSLYPLSTGTLETSLRDTAKSLKQKAAHLEVLFYHTRLGAYKEQAEKLISDAIRDGKQKDRIRRLSRAYVSALISSGYSTRYLRDIVTTVFFRNAKINGFEDIQQFFQKVTGSDIKYQAVFTVDKIFSQIEKPCSILNLKIIDSLQGELEQISSKKQFKDERYSHYAIIAPIEAKDVFSARNAANRQLEAVSTLTNVFYHKVVPNWGERVLMINSETQRSRVVGLTTNAMLMCEDNRPLTAAKRLNRFLEEFSLQSRRSFKRFFRVTELHALALKSDSPENQLLNLWVALEALVPSYSDENKAKINRIIDACIPLLNLDYIANLTGRFVRDFRNFDKALLRQHLEGVPGTGDRERLLRVLLLKPYSKKKIALYKDIGDFELLRNRAAYYERTLRSTSNIKALLNAHATRVSWQVRRIYRTRNLIVHTGNTPSYIDVLIKNLHDYLDVIISTIIHLASDGEKVNSVVQVFSFSALQYQEYISNLPTEDTRIVEENIDRYILSLKSRI